MSVISYYIIKMHSCWNMTSGIFGPCSCTPEPSVYIPAAGANCITGKQESIFRRLNVLLKLRWPSIFGRAQVHFEASVPLWPVQHQRHFQEWISESCDFCLKNKLPLRQCKWLWVANLESLSERIGHLSLPHQQIPQVFHPQQAWEACTDVVLQVKVIDKLDSDPACASSCASNDPPQRESLQCFTTSRISHPHLSTKAGLLRCYLSHCLHDLFKEIKVCHMILKAESISMFHCPTWPQLNTWHLLQCRTAIEVQCIFTSWSAWWAKRLLQRVERLDAPGRRGFISQWKAKDGLSKPQQISLHFRD